MAKFAELTEAQQKQITEFQDQLFRVVEGMTARAFAQVSHMLDVANAGTLELLGSLDAGEVLPTGTGLAGAQLLTAGDLVKTLITYGQASDAFNSKEMRQSRIKSAGIINTI